MRRTVALVGWVLRLAPSEFAGRYRVEYIATVRARMADAAALGRVAVVKTSLREVGGALRAVARLRLCLEDEGRHKPGRGGGSTMFDQALQDIRHAVRTLVRNRGFSTSAALVLALGLGANTAIFSAVNAFFFRPLPFADPDRLVLLYETNPEFGWTHAQVAPANALDWRDQVEAFGDVAMYANMGAMDVTLHIDDEPVLVGGIGVTGNFFSVLGVDAALGRTFRFEETWEGDDAVAVISHELWTSRFGADPDVIGSVVPMGGSAQPVEVIGVMPAGFTFPNDDTALWYTYGWAQSNREEVWFRRAHSARAVARLESDVSLEEADSQLQVVVRRLQLEYPATNSVMGAGLMPLRDFKIRGVRTPLLVLLGAVTILLLLACANVANLMLVRADDRSREVALRHALGAGRWRVVRQFLTESVLLGCSGGVLGLAIGWFGVQGMARMTRLGIDGATEMALDARVVGFTLLVAIASGVLFGIAPAVRGGRDDLQGVLREGGHGHSVGRRALRFTHLLVAIEVALALVLVVGAGLMVRSAWILREVDPGFRVDGVLAVRFSLPSARYGGRSDVLAFWDRFSEALEGRPGIERAGTVANLPLAGASWSSQLHAETWPPDRVGFEILHRRADRGYFEALDIPLVRGRLFEATDGPDDPLVVVVNETFAREHFPDEDPIGQRIVYDRVPTPESNWYEIIGIVGDQHQVGLNVPPRAEVFENRDQDWGRTAWVVMRTSVAPVSIMPAVRGALAELDPQIPIADVRPLRDVWSSSMDRERFILTLLTVFGVTALLLATVGVYGVTAQAARRRTQEIGVRIALGASAREVVGMMLRQGFSVVGLGLLAGLGSALLATRALSSLVFGIEPNDPTTLASVVALLGVVALAACYVPARRATAVDPVSSLKVQ